MYAYFMLRCLPSPIQTMAHFGFRPGFNYCQWYDEHRLQAVVWLAGGIAKSPGEHLYLLSEIKRLDPRNVILDAEDKQPAAKEYLERMKGQNILSWFDL